MCNFLDRIMTNLALIENNTIVDIIVGDPADFPFRVDVTNKPWGSGWVTSDGGVTFDPPVVVPQFATNFSAEDLLLAFTRAEFNLIDGSNNPNVKKLVRSLTERQRAQIRVTDPEYIPDIGLLLSESLISQPRHDELIQGLPII